MPVGAPRPGRITGDLRSSLRRWLRRGRYAVQDMIDPATMIVMAGGKNVRGDLVPRLRSSRRALGLRITLVRRPRLKGGWGLRIAGAGAGIYNSAWPRPQGDTLDDFSRRMSVLSRPRPRRYRRHGEGIAAGSSGSTAESTDDGTTRCWAGHREKIRAASVPGRMAGAISRTTAKRHAHCRPRLRAGLGREIETCCVVGCAGAGDRR